MDTFATVVGAGIVGLAVSSEIGDKGPVYVLEKEETYGRGISSRNSEVIHSGIYYPPGSLKAMLCVEGNRLLYEIGERNGLPFRRTGKLVVATDEEQEGYLHHLKENGERNGVEELEILPSEEVRKLQPCIRARLALWVPSTGILNAHKFMDYFYHKAREKGVEFAFGVEVVGISRVNGGFEVEVREPDGSSFSFTTEVLVNSAGLYADRVAGFLGYDYRIHFAKGVYFSLPSAKAKLVDVPVYPVPDRYSLGIHYKPELDGRGKLGPDIEYIERKEDYTVPPDKARDFHESVRTFLPFVEPEDLVPEMAGIRPKLQGPGDDFRDFVIRQEEPGFVNLVGIDSPGLTAAPAIAKMVAGMV